VKKKLVILSKAVYGAIFALWVIVAFLPTSLRGQGCERGMITISKPGSYIAIEDQGKLNLRQSFTLECWAKVFNFYQNGGLIERADRGGATYWSLLLDANNNMAVRTGSSPSNYFTTPELNDLYSWHHYAVTITKGDSIRFYRDGVWVASHRLLGEAIANNDDSIRIGISVAPNGRTFIGDIDDIRIWDTALTAIDIQLRKNNVLSGFEKHLVGYYTLDDLSGNRRIHDFSEHGNDGYLKGNDAAIVPSSSPVQNPARGYKLQALEDAIVFPTVSCSSSYDTIIHIRNVGYEQITATAATLTGTAFSVTTNNFTLPADTSIKAEVRIHFAPTSAGVYYDTLVVGGTSSCIGSISVPLMARFDSVGITLQPSSINFGQLFICDTTPHQQSIKVRNTGSVDVTVSPLGFTQNTNIRIVSPTGPFPLPAGKDTTIILQIENGSIGAFSTQLILGLDKCGRISRTTITGSRVEVKTDLSDSILFPEVLADLNGVTLDTTITIKNTGTTDLLITSVDLIQDFSFKLGKPFQTTNLKPGGELRIPIEFTTNRCGEFTNLLRVRGKQCNYEATAIVKVHVLEPLLQIKNALIDLASTCTAKDTIIWVKNINPYPIIIQGIASSAPDMLSTIDTLFPKRLEPQDSTIIPIRFTPGVSGDYDLIAGVSLLPCGSKNVHVKVSTGLKNIVYTPSLLGFGRGCDLTPITKAVTITNNTPNEVTFTSSVFYGVTNYTLAGVSFPFTLKAGSSKVFTVTYAPLLNSKEVGSLTFFTKDGCSVSPLQLVGSREFSGAAWKSSSVDFGIICPQTTGLGIVEIENTGLDTTEIGSISFTGDPEIQLISSPKFILGKSIEKFTFTVSPGNYGDFTGTLTITTFPCGKTLSIPIKASAGPLPHIIFSKSSYDFDTISVGDSSTFCLTIKNPSCTPLTITPDLFDFGVAPFKVSSSDTIPLTLNRDEEHSWCFTYIPHKRGHDSLYLTNKLGLLDTLILIGQAVGPEIITLEDELDFGKIRTGEPTKRTLHIKNVGDEQSLVTIGEGNPPYIFGPYSTTVAAQASDKLEVTFTPTSLGEFYDTIHVAWKFGLITVPIKGEGVEHGPVPSKSKVLFGDVRVNHEREIKLKLAGSSEAAITNLSVTSDNPSFSASLDQQQLLTEQDTAILSIVFSPLIESPYQGALTVNNSLHPITIQLTGNGVESHLFATPDTVRFGKVKIGSNKAGNITIQDRGHFPLSITKLNTRDPFTVEQIASDDSILFSTPRSVAVTFAPITRGDYFDSVVIDGDAPEKTKVIYLLARGVNGNIDQPDVMYHVGSATVRVCDSLSLPITLSSNDALDGFDTLSVSIAYDPTLLYIHWVKPAAIFENWSWSLLREDSAVTIFGYGPGINLPSPTKIFDLHTEALLGPHLSSDVTVTNALPGNGISTLSDTGIVTVFDCNGNPPHVALRGKNSLGIIHPNPVSNSALIEYEIGINGKVMIDLIDPLGRVVKQLINQTAEAGKHQALVSFVGVPSGYYYYVIRSNDYYEKKAVVISH